MELFATLFYDLDDKNKAIANSEGILPIPLYKGMKITIHGHHEEYQVDRWDFHFGHPDENAGLRIYLRKI